MFAKKFSLTSGIMLGLLSMGGVSHGQTARDVINGYADLALAKYSDSLATAQSLDETIQSFVANPTAQTHQAAKDAWIAARAPYQQTEVYRFGNAVVDAWEGKVNAWPLDEGLIDYVDTGFYGDASDENGFFRANVVSNSVISVGGQTVDASEITPELLEQFHEIDGVEANVATGYHAIEFLLWGQDTNGTEAGAGNRPYTDYASGDACTNGNCDRRAQYLTAASALLVSDLKEIVDAWKQDGDARTQLEESTDQQGLAAILTGMGSLSYGELAGERMKLGLILHDPEEEHDCFADNTHNSHFFDAKGIQNVFLGKYVTSQGDVIEVPSLASLSMQANPELGAKVSEKLSATMSAMAVMKLRADSGIEAYDQMIGYGNDDGNAVVQNAIDALVAQTRSFEELVAALDTAKVSLEGSDSLDNPGAVFE